MESHSFARAIQSVATKRYPLETFVASMASLLSRLLVGTEPPGTGEYNKHYDKGKLTSESNKVNLTSMYIKVCIIVPRVMHHSMSRIPSLTVDVDGQHVSR